MDTSTLLIPGALRGLNCALAEIVLADGEQLVATARRPESFGDLVEDRREPLAAEMAGLAASHAA